MWGDKGLKTLKHNQRLMLLKYVSPFFANFENNDENHYCDVVMGDNHWWLIGEDKVTLEKEPWWHPDSECYDKDKVKSGKHGKVATVKQLAKLDAMIISCAAQVNSILSQGIKEYHSDE